MIQILEQIQENIVATKASEKLTTKDYEKLLPLLKNALKKHDKIRWYFEMENFEGWELKAFWKDVKFDIKHASDFEKIAMVGDKQWEKWMTELMKPFTSAEIKFFELSEKEKGLTWIKN